MSTDYLTLCALQARLSRPLATLGDLITRCTANSVTVDELCDQIGIHRDMIDDGRDSGSWAQRVPRSVDMAARAFFAGRLLAS